MRVYVIKRASFLHKNQWVFFCIVCSRRQILNNSRLTSHIVSNVSSTCFYFLQFVHLKFQSFFWICFILTRSNLFFFVSLLSFVLIHLLPSHSVSLSIPILSHSVYFRPFRYHQNVGLASFGDDDDVERACGPTHENIYEMERIVSTAFVSN